jgi:N-acetylmuramoyl-L-alanine amidase
MGIQLVYPTNHHKTHAESTFAIGRVSPAQALLVNQQPVALSRQGYFGHKLPLTFGVNRFVFACPSGEQRELVVTRHQPVWLPEGQIAPHTLPMADHALMPGDTLSLTVAAGANQSLKAELVYPDGTVLLATPMTAKGKTGFVDNRTAVFAELTQTQPLLAKPCVYAATVTLPACAQPADKLTLRWISATQTVTDPCHISLWDRPRFAQITGDRVVMRTSPPEGSRLTPQRQDAWVVITGKQGNWWRVRLSGERTAWLPADKISTVSTTPEPVMNLPAQTLKTCPVNATHSRVLLPGLPHPVPFHVESRPDGLDIDWYGLVSHCDFIHYHPEDRVIQRIDWSQPNADTFRLALTVPRLCGVEVSFNPDGAELLVKQLGLKPRILIDPGHGGAETGSTGPDGTREKTLNLSLALLTADALRQKGLDVTLTRSSDVDVSLTDRTTQAEAFDMVISLHHNALPDGRDPQQAQGLSTYYYHAMAKPLAQRLCDGLSQQLKLTRYGVFYDSLALTRIPQAMAVLVETGFMTHPQEFERLQTPAFRHAFALTLADQVAAFIRESHG